MIFGEHDRDMDIDCKQAFEEGYKEAKLKIARSLLLKGSTPEFINKVTGLSLDKIINFTRQLFPRKRDQPITNTVTDGCGSKGFSL